MSRGFDQSDQDSTASMTNIIVVTGDNSDFDYQGIKSEMLEAVFNDTC
jgi:hypothetical protein